MKPSRTPHRERCRQEVGEKRRSLRGGAIPVRRPGGAAQREEWRLEVLMDFAKQTRDLKWSRKLFLLLLEELYIGDEFDEIIGSPETLHSKRYPQAVAFAIAARRSWRPEDLHELATDLAL